MKTKQPTAPTSLFAISINLLLLLSRRSFSRSNSWRNAGLDVACSNDLVMEPVTNLLCINSNIHEKTTYVDISKANCIHKEDIGVNVESNMSFLKYLDQQYKFV